MEQQDYVQGQLLLSESTTNNQFEIDPIALNTVET